MPKRSPKASSKKASGQGTRVREPEPGAHFVPSARVGRPRGPSPRSSRLRSAPFTAAPRCPVYLRRFLGNYSKTNPFTHLWPLIGTADHRGPLNPRLRAPDRCTAACEFVVRDSITISAALIPPAYHAVNVMIHFLSRDAAVGNHAAARCSCSYFSGRFDRIGRMARRWRWQCCGLCIRCKPRPSSTSTQRTELMMAFFYLATLYCSLRYWTVLFPIRRKSVRVNSQRVATTFCVVLRGWHWP